MATLPVHTAALNKQLSYIQHLIEQKPEEVNAGDADGRTPLHWAATSGAADIAAFLIDNKAEVDKVDSSGWTALHVAGSQCGS